MHESSWDVVPVRQRSGVVSWSRFCMWWLRPKVGIPVLCALLIVSAPFIYCSWRLSVLPDIGDPFDVAALLQVDLAPAENAFTGYRFAFAKYVENSSAAGEGLKAIDELGWKAATPEVVKWLDDNQASLSRFRDASRGDQAVALPPREYPRNQSDHVQEMRNFSQLSHYLALRQEAAGDLEGLWETLLPCFRASRHCGMQGHFMERITGMAIHSMMAGDITRWARHARVTEAQLQFALSETRRAYALTPLPSVTFQCEYLFEQNVIQEDMADFFDDEMREERHLRLYLNGEPALSKRILQHTFANYLAYCDRPFAQRPPLRRGEPLLFERDVPEKGGPAAADLQALKLEETLAYEWRSMLVLVQAIDRERARQAALELTLALQIHFRRHGEFPAALNDPSFQSILPAIPDDPFAVPGTTLQYRREETKAVIWSIGADGKNDDGCVESHRLDNPGDMIFVVEMPSQGELSAK